jgi:hypothetical protein
VAGDLALERGAFRPVRQVPAEQQVPHVFERPLGAQLDRVIVPVLVEALQPADVADPGMRDDDPREPGGRVRAVAVPGDLPGAWHLRPPCWRDNEPVGIRLAALPGVPLPDTSSLTYGIHIGQH